MSNDSTIPPHRTPWRLAAGLALLGGFIVINAVAYNNARSFLFFSASGKKTSPPETLSLPAKLETLLGGVSNPRPANTRAPVDFGLNADEVSIPVGDEISISAWHIAGPEPGNLVILFHGYASKKDSLLEAARALHDLGVNTLLVDFRGSGDSSESYTTVGYLEAEDVAAAFEHARDVRGVNPKHIVLYGTSMGGAAITRAVATGRVNPGGIILEIVFDNLLTTVQRRFSLMGVPGWPSAQLLLFWAGEQIDLDPWGHNPADYARSITAPALVLHASEDQRADLEQGKAIFAGLAGRKEFVVFEAKHQKLVEADARRWKVAVGEFLESVVGK